MRRAGGAAGAHNFDVQSARCRLFCANVAQRHPRVAQPRHAHLRVSARRPRTRPSRHRPVPPRSQPRLLAPLSAPEMAVCAPKMFFVYAVCPSIALLSCDSHYPPPHTLRGTTSAPLKHAARSLPRSLTRSLPGPLPPQRDRCELLPYIVVRKSDASSTTADIPEENPVDGAYLRYRWSGPAETTRHIIQHVRTLVCSLR